MKINRNKFISILLLIENLLIFLIIVFLILNVPKIDKTYLQQLKIVKNYFYFHSGFLLISFFSSFLLIFFHIFLWFFLFRFSKIEKNLLEASYTYFRVHARRLLSPFGPLSPIIFLEAENKNYSLFYISYSFFILLGSILFFILIFFSFKYFIVLIPSIFFIIVVYFVKKNFLKNFDTWQFLLLTSITFLLELTGFFIFYLTTKAFLENINIYYIFIAYLIWVITSSVSPLLYGTGSSEALSLLYIYYLGYNPYTFLLSLIYYRLITTYLPLLGLLINPHKITTKTVDK